MESTWKYNKFDTLPAVQSETQLRVAQGFENLATGNLLAFDSDNAASSKEYSALTEDYSVFSKHQSAFNEDHSASRKDHSSVSKDQSALNNDYAVLNKDDSSSVFAIQIPRSEFSPCESDDMKYDYDDDLDDQLAEPMPAYTHDSVESCGQEEESTDTNSTSGSEDYEIAFLYEGPLTALKAEALSLIFDAYQQCRSPETGPETNDAESTPNDERTADNGSDGIRSSEGQNPTSRRRKRKKSDQEEDEGKGKRKKASPRSPATAQGSRKQPLLACPFYKFNFRKHRSCCISKLDAISRVKQHLDRRHQPPIHCPSCFKEFETVPLRDEHSRHRPSCKVLPEKTWDAVSADQNRRLKDRFSRKKTTEENWYIMFDILFPGSPKPTSPYIDAELSEDLAAFREFVHTRGPGVVNDLILRDLPSSVLPDDDEVQALIRSMLPEFIDRLFDLFQNADYMTEEQHALTVNHSPAVLHSPINHDSGYHTANHDDPSPINFQDQLPEPNTYAQNEDMEDPAELLFPTPSFDYDDFILGNIDLDDPSELFSAFELA